MGGRSMNRSHSENAALRWERALGDVAKSIRTFRSLNLFSVGLRVAWERLRGKVDFADLIYAEATRLIDPLAFGALFAPGARAHSNLPQTYDHEFLALDSAFLGNERGQERARIFSAILASAKDRIWVSKVLQEVFDVRAQLKANDSELVREVPEPRDEDRQMRRFKHPTVLFEYHQSILVAEDDRERFVRYFETLSPETLAVEFALHLRELLLLYRQGKTSRLENFISDLFRGDVERLRSHPDRLQAMCIAIATLSHEIRPSGGLIIVEESQIVKLLWLILSILPEERVIAELSIIADQAAMLILPQIHFPFRFRKEIHELSDYFMNLMPLDRIERLLSNKAKAQEILASAFADKLKLDNSFVNFDGTKNNNWVFIWFVNSANDKPLAQKQVVTAVKRQFDVNNDAFLGNLKSYFFDNNWPAEAERTKAAQDIFGPEYIWMLEKLKVYNAI